MFGHNQWENKTFHAPWSLSGKVPAIRQPSGPPVQQGLVGPTGPAGPKGPVGDKGPIGNKGATGDTGATGNVGPTGATGQSGDLTAAELTQLRGILNHMRVTNGHLEIDDFRMNGHIIPTTNATYDIGSAEYKIRHIFISDN